MRDSITSYLSSYRTSLKVGIFTLYLYLVIYVLNPVRTIVKCLKSKCFLCTNLNLPTLDPDDSQPVPITVAEWKMKMAHHHR